MIGEVCGDARATCTQTRLKRVQGARRCRTATRNCYESSRHYKGEEDMEMTHLSRSWRTPLLSVLVVPCFAFMASSEEPQDRFVEDCIAKIRAYEGLYRTSRITVNVNADDHSPPDLESIRMEVTVDGERMRYDERAVYANKPDELNTIVSDGERLKAWSRRETNRFGQGTVKPHEKNEVRAWSHSLYFRPCESYAFLSYPQIERVSHENREVTLSFYHPEYDQRYLVRYEECGEYMRPLFLDQQLSDKKIGHLEQESNINTLMGISASRMAV